MKEPNDNPSNPISISKMLYKGDVDDPQSVIVIGSTCLSGDIWVNLGTIEIEHPDFPPIDTVCELASILCSKGDDAPRSDSIYAASSEAEYYGVECPEGEALWAAKFYFSDHRRWSIYADRERDLSAIWQSSFGTTTIEQKLCVSAHCTETRTDWRIDLTTGPYQPVRRLGPHIHRSFSRSEVEPIKLFRLGVLFIHGIGKHNVRDTLVKFGEPILAFWNRLLSITNRNALSTLGADARSLFYPRIRYGMLRNRADQEGFLDKLGGFKKTDCDAVTADQSVAHAGNRVISMGACVEHTNFPNFEAEDATSTLVRVSMAGSDGKVHEEHALFAEAWWTAKTVYPSATELFSWISEAIPVFFRMHIGGSLRANTLPLRRDSGKPVFMKLAVLPVIFIQAIFAFILFLLLILFQAFLLLTSTISLLPIPKLKKIVRSSIESLMGTVGQSYALKTSPVRRNAIVSKVTKDLEDLSNCCDDLAVISHSQGAEIARIVFQRQRWPSVKKWITLGAGIKPLAMLEPDQIRASRGYRYFFSSCTLLTLLALATIVSQALLAHKFNTETPIETSIILCIWSLYIVVVAIFMVFDAMHFDAQYTLKTMPEVFETWTDYYASHDPVPNGSHISKFKNELKQMGHSCPQENEIHNYRSTIKDHTSYFKNIEQFVAPVAMSLFDLLGFRASAAEIAGCFREASRRRENRVFIYWWVSNFVFSMILAYCILMTWFNWRTWHTQLLFAWQNSEGILSFLIAGPFTDLIGDFIVEISPALFVAIFFLIVRSVILKYYTEKCVNDLVCQLAEKSAFHGEFVQANLEKNQPEARPTTSHSPAHDFSD